MKHCRPTSTLTLNTFLLILIFGMLIYGLGRRFTYNRSNVKPTTVIVEQPPLPFPNRLPLLPNYPYSNVLIDPYAPPLRDERYLEGMVSNNNIYTSYRQLGILISKDNNTILPLMGKQVLRNGQKWNYYTINNNSGTLNSGVKLPLEYNKKSCTNEYGCNELYTGNEVLVRGFNKHFTVELYDNNQIQYI